MTPSHSPEPAAELPATAAGPAARAAELEAPMPPADTPAETVPQGALDAEHIGPLSSWKWATVLDTASAAGRNPQVASLAALVVAACVAVGVLHWSPDAASSEASADATVEEAGAPLVAAEPVPAGEGTQDASGAWPDPLVSLYETRADAARPIKLKFSIIDPRRAASRVRSSKPKPVGTVAEARPSPPLSSRWPSRPGTLPPVMPVSLTTATPRLGTSAAPPRGVPAPPPAQITAASPTPVSTAPPPVEARRAAEDARRAPATIASTADRRDPRPGEEELIRTTLARFGTAYSRLDASAAREVWPSVDVRALERAFDDLKSQELRFEGCSLTVDGARAKAACTGRAVYVPRIGNQSPRSTSREWTFELRKADDERWTIASARTRSS